jgi:hypothetical protein
MHGCCKDLIVAAVLDPSVYATHSSKRRGTLEAMKAGLSDAQIQELGRWLSSTMVARYARGDEEMRETLADSIRIDAVLESELRWRRRRVVSSVWGSLRPAKPGFIVSRQAWSRFWFIRVLLLFILSGWFWVGAGGRYFFDRLGFAI